MPESLFVKQRPLSSNETLLSEIADYCRRAGMAESTFGRRVVNDGKFVSRLKCGGRITTQTAERIRAYLQQTILADESTAALSPAEKNIQARVPDIVSSRAQVGTTNIYSTQPEQNFRFYDNRQKYLLFVNTCSEKDVIARRIAMELDDLVPRPPALRLFDAGVGDGTVLARVMRSMHDKFPTTPFYVVGKEISLEDVRLALDKMPERFCEHPATMLVMTNMYYSEAPWLRPLNSTAAENVLWHEVVLSGTTSAQFDRQICELGSFLRTHWTASISKTSGNPLYERPVALVIYRGDHRFLLDSVRPEQGIANADFDLVIASQPYRARAPVEFKARKIVAPLVRALGHGGRLIGIHSHGQDAGLDIIQRVWPGENPFQTSRDELLRATKQALGADARGYSFNVYADQRAIFQYEMHTLPSEISSSIGTSTLLAAWNAAVYVAQIEDHRLQAVMSDSGYLEATREVLQRHGRLWFQNESYVIARHRQTSRLSTE